MIRTKHFSPYDYACKCGCGLQESSKEFLDMMEDFRAFINKEEEGTHIISVSSGNRCQSHNLYVGGTDKMEKDSHIVSLHVPIYKDAVTNEIIKRNVFAMDTHSPRMPMGEYHYLALKAWKEGILIGGLGYYSWGCHIDNGRKRTWGHML